MRKLSLILLCSVISLQLASCSPRDFLTRRLAADLIAGSSTFRAAQQFQLRTGILSNQEHLFPEYLVLQHRGWISATQARCAPDITPPPCWDVTLTPSGVDTFRPLLSAEDAGLQTLRIPAARRELVAVTGISKQGRLADVEFTWRWGPLNEVGAVLYSSNVRYRSTASFRCYDDGWRIVQGGASHPSLPLDDALKSAEPVQ
jgi:hypothetical protein